MNINTKTLIEEFKSSILVTRPLGKGGGEFYKISSAERIEDAWELGLTSGSIDYIAKVIIPDQSVIIYKSQCMVLELTSDESLILNLRREDGGCLDHEQLEAKFNIGE